MGDENSLDLGAVRLGSVYAAGLEAGKIITVPENEWRNPPADFEFFVVLGTPKELRTQTVPEGKRFPVAFDLKRGALLVEQIARPDWIPETPHRRFYGRILENDAEGAVKVEDLVGASGGPILGCRRGGDGVIRAVPVAVQTAWFKDNKLVEGDLLTEHADWLAAQV